MRVTAACGRRNAEVHDLEQAGIVHEDVRRLEVAMDDSGLMSDGHAGRYVEGESAGLLEVHRFAIGNLSAQGMGREVFHRDGIGPLQMQEVIDSNDVLMRNHS